MKLRILIPGIVIRAAAVVILSMALITLLGIGVMTFRSPSVTTFDVKARTEYLEFVTRRPATGRWILEEVQIRHGFNPGTEIFSGAFQRADDVRVRIERVGSGPLWIFIEALSGSSAGTFYHSDEPVRQAETTLGIVVDDLPTRIAQGHSILIPVEGEVTLGQIVGSPSPGSHAILLGGEIQLLGRTIFADNVHSAGKIEIGMGDRFQVDGPMTPVEGFLRVGEDTAIDTAYRVVGRRGEIVRPGGRVSPVSASTWARTVNDQFVRGIGSFMGVLAMVATLVSFLVTMQEKNRTK